MRKSNKSKDLEENLTNLDEEVVMPSMDIISYNVLHSCANLYDMYNNKELEIKPYFQRNFVWKPAVQTCFIDSLLKGLPIPSLFIAEDTKKNKRIVIDGLQRLSTIKKFFENDKWRLSKLPDIDQNISGKSVSVIKQKLPKFYQKIKNANIPVITIKYDSSEKSQMDSVFNFFHRINTGGLKLTNQEVRNCIYSGKFNDMLIEIAKSEDWKNIIRNTTDNDRLESEEMILRVFAFIDKLNDYKEPLAKFLNDYMSEKQNISDSEIEEMKQKLLSSLSFIKDKIGNLKTDYKGKTVKEGLLVGIAKNINTLHSKAEFQSMLQRFKNADEFKPENLKQGLSKKENVKSRLEKSIEIFGA